MTFELNIFHSFKSVYKLNSSSARCTRCCNRFVILTFTFPCSNSLLSLLGSSGFSITYSLSRLRFRVIFGSRGVSRGFLSPCLEATPAGVASPPISSPSVDVKGNDDGPLGEIEVKGNTVTVGEGVSRENVAKVGEGLKSPGVEGSVGVFMTVPNRPAGGILRVIHLEDVSGVGCPKEVLSSWLLPMTGCSPGLKLAAFLITLRIATGIQIHL